MKLLKLLEITLSLFDGGAAAAGGDSAGAAAAGEGSGETGETQARPGSTHDPAGHKQGKEGDVQVTSDTLEERRKAFQELVNGEYKDVYTEDTQRIISRSSNEVKALEQQLAGNQPVIDMLMQRYNIPDGDVAKLAAAIESDNALWNAAAEDAGMDVEQYKQFQKLQRENAHLMKLQQAQRNEQMVQQQMQRWMQEAEEVRAAYPDFDFAAEAADPRFLSMLKSGVPVQHAYEVAHLDNIKTGVAQHTARQTEKQVVDNIRSKGARPAENGTASQSAFTIKDDVSRLSRQERAEIARRAGRGETISF